VKPESYLIEKERYEKITLSDYYKSLIREIENDENLYNPRTIPYLIGITDFGKNFMNACFR
jgi:hypothetical protein